MLKKSILKKILVVLSAIFILFILYLFPKKDNMPNIFELEESAPTTTVYLIDSNNLVSRVNVITEAKEQIDQVKEKIEYLTIGSRNASHIKNGFSPVIPENTKILSVDIDNDLLKINFSKDFFKVSAENEEKMISAIIFSLTTIEGISKISIYIEDTILHEMPHSKKPLPTILDRTFGVNKTYNVTKVRGTVATTVYFLSKQDDYFYYVPVTTINNQEEKDKIEIIIEELTSRTMYQTNLISYLNNVQDIDYEISDDFVLVKLASDLYHDLNNSHLLEKVTYSINLSIKENYNVTTVLYMVDDLILYSFFL